MATTFSASTTIKSAEVNANFLEKKARTYTTTATAAGTTTLALASNQIQFFTGTASQTVTLPVASTMSLGYGFEIFNNSTGIVTVNSSGANLVQSMAAGSKLEVICILASGTSAASWQAVYSPNFSVGTNPMTTGGDIIFGGASGLPTRLANGAAFQTLQSNGTTVAPTWVNQKVLQVVRFDSTAYAGNTASIPADDTIPQITEGTQFMSLAITPKKTTSSLKIDVVAMVGCDTASRLISALFRDSTADAIGATMDSIAGADQTATVSFSVIVASASLSLTTFTYRAGNTAGQTRINGVASRLFGGVMSSSMTITEFEN